MANSGLPYAWVNVSKEDSDPANLYNLITEAIQIATGGSNFPSLDSISMPSDMPYHAQDVVYREWAQWIYAGVTGRINIVLDALDLLLKDAPSFAFLQVFIEDLPANIHLFMLSRQMLPLKLQPVKMKRDFAMISNQNLAFTAEETAAFFQHICGISIDSEQLQKILMVSEGWVGGLILLSQILDRMPDDARNFFIMDELSERFKTEAFHYFDDEIISRLPARERYFLFKTSILPELDPIFVNELLGMKDAESILREHEAKNLFVHSIYDNEKRRWLFRYHQLLRDFLNRKLCTALSGDQVDKLYQEVGSLYEKWGDPEASVRYYLEAKVYASAASALSKSGIALVKQGRREELRNLLAALPEHIIREDPWLLLYLAETKRISDIPLTVPILEEAYRLFEMQGNLQGQLFAMANLLYGYLNRGHVSIPVSTLIQESDALLASPGGELFLYERARLLLQMGFALILRGDDPRKGVHACLAAHSLAQKSGSVTAQFMALMYAVMGLAFVGEFEQADQLYERGLKLSRDCKYLEFYVFNYILYFQLCYLRGDLQLTMEISEKACKEAEKFGFTYLYSISLVQAAIIAPHTGKFAETEEVAQQALRVSTTLDDRFQRGVIFTSMGKNNYFKGDLEKAREQLDQAISSLSSAISGGGNLFEYGQTDKRLGLGSFGRFR